VTTNSFQPPRFLRNFLKNQVTPAAYTGRETIGVHRTWQRQQLVGPAHRPAETRRAGAAERSSAMNATCPSDRVFTTTHWTVVLTAGQRESQHADEALEKLCRGYWYPVYVFLRRSGLMMHDAEDLTQAFFERVLSKDYLRAVDRTKGKFRSYLLAMLRHFLANHRRDARTQKRGGSTQFVSLDADSLDEVERSPAVADLSAEKSFDRQWAMTLLEQVISTLRAEYQATGKGALFERLKIFLTGEKAGMNYVELAADLNTTEAALKMTISRLRKRYGELLRTEIARTVSSPEETEDELRALFAALS
jgi:RNA polymerase sigma factor (sigma-70 family)